MASPGTGNKATERNQLLQLSIMNLRCIAVSIILPGLVSTCVYGQSSSPTPPPELKKWDVWIGDWNLSGTAKDTPTGPEYKVNWHLHEHWILNGFFVQVDQTWKGNGQELHSMEILSYDPVKKIHTVSGFSGDGWTWALTATFDKTTTTEEGVATGPDGAIVTSRIEWQFSSDGKTLSGTQQSEQNGVRWTAFTVNGTKSR